MSALFVFSLVVGVYVLCGLIVGVMVMAGGRFLGCGLVGCVEGRVMWRFAAGVYWLRIV